MQIETDTYTVAASRHARRGIEAIAARWWWAFALPLVAGLALSLWDWRILLAVFCLLLVVYPGIMAMAYYNCALSPESASELIPHRVVFYEDKMRIAYSGSDPDGADAKVVDVAYSDIRRVDEPGQWLEVAYAAPDGKQRVAEVPFAAFSSPADIAAVRELLRPYYDDGGDY